MQIGIVGLPASGKTTFLQTMTRTHLEESAARHKQANVAMVKVPDVRVSGAARVSPRGVPFLQQVRREVKVENLSTAFPACH